MIWALNDPKIHRGPASSDPALQVVRGGEGPLPALLAPDRAAERCVIEFFTAHIRNSHTRKAGCRRLRSNSIWPEAGCSSTGSSSARSCP